ncbi:GldG family protein [bacterium]|nr:GldG family protein [bacterium]
MRRAFQASIFSLGLYNDGLITSQILADIDLLIIPEPNIRYSSEEIDAIRRFVSFGGSLFMIADHGGSDRNFDGWDSWHWLPIVTSGETRFPFLVLGDIGTGRVIAIGDSSVAVRALCRLCLLYGFALLLISEYNDRNQVFFFGLIQLRRLFL